MATGNFYNKNASNIYAIYPENAHDDFIFQDVETNVSEAIDEYIRESNGYWTTSMIGYRDAKKIESFYVSEELAGISIGIKIDVLMRSGYYEGANLDYEISYFVESVEFDELSEAWQAFYDVATYDCDMRVGFAKIQAKNASNRLSALHDRVVSDVEKILKENCTHILQVSARFSNGETWYSEVKKS